MKNFDFVKKNNIFFIITAIVVVLGIACFLIRGFNIDTDFAGGTTMQIDIGMPLNADELNKIGTVAETVLGEKISSIQKSGSEATEVFIKTRELPSESREALFQAIADEYGLDEKALLDVTNVGASMSADLRRAALLSTVIAVVLMLVYIAFRFRFTSAIAAVICLCHDLFVMLIAYSLLQIPMQSTMIAALLTILGYSINATIIIFDRIRELKKLNRDKSFGENVNTAIHATLTRSVNTTVTTLFTIGMVYIFGVTSIKDFALPLIVGIVAGLYSSVCLSGNLWLILDGAFQKLKKKNTVHEQ